MLKRRRPLPRSFLLLLIVASLSWFGLAARAGAGWGMIMMLGWLVGLGIAAWFIGYDSREPGG